MSKRVEDVATIEHEPDGTCELCGKTAETRPYGPGGKRICYECGKKDEKATERRMNEVLFGGKPKS